MHKDQFLQEVYITSRIIGAHSAVRFVVITDYKGKKFLGWKTEKTLVGSILTQRD